MLSLADFKLGRCCWDSRLPDHSYAGVEILWKINWG